MKRPQGCGLSDCAIRSCSKERGYELFSQCVEIRGCDMFNWLGDQATR